MDATRVDQIVQFALARAAQEDDWKSRELGPIHLIKYVYLADLAYARSHEGETYTGIVWTFFHYGPWSPVVFDRLDEAAAAIGANVRKFESPKYDRDVIRYSVESGDAEELEARLDRALPLEVSGAVKSAVRKFSNDTAGLLDWVYRTPPMLVAAPNERLNFGRAAAELAQAKAVPPPEMSRRQEKKLEAALASARQEFKARLESLRRVPSAPPESAPPRYDEVFAQGSSWLEEEAAVEPLRGEVRFPEDIWKSDWRDPHGGE